MSAGLTDRVREARDRLRLALTTPWPERKGVEFTRIDPVRHLVATVRAKTLREVREVVERMDAFELDRGRGYGCHCEMKREKTVEFYAADWLNRDEVLTALTALEATDGNL